MADSSHSSSLLDLSGLDTIRNPKPRISLVATEWNDQIIAELLAGAESVLRPYLGEATQPDIIRVPGAFELPFACRKYWESFAARPDLAPEAMIAFGAVIRGGTPHFEYVSQAVTQGILELNLQLPIPVIFGVLTLDTELQAWERLGGLQGHKGRESAITALKMIHLTRKFNRRQNSGPETK